jgi:hypothetical protein
MISILTGISSAYTTLKNALIRINVDFNALPLSVQRGGIYGLFSKPLVKTVTTVLKQGHRNIVLSEENPTVQIELLDGEVALFDGMNTVKLSRERGITIIAPAGVSIGGEGAQKLLTETFVSLFNAHTHGAAGVATTPPTTPVDASAVSTLFTEAI